MNEFLDLDTASLIATEFNYEIQQVSFDIEDTGIGMTTGGVIIGFIALSPSDQVSVKPIQNPGQIDAHRYSELVLKGTVSEGLARKCTPKFERAKMVSIGSSHYIYVSGTAST